MQGIFLINTVEGERAFTWHGEPDVHNDLSTLVCEGKLSWRRADFYMNLYLMGVTEVRTVNEGLIWYRQPEFKP